MLERISDWWNNLEQKQRKILIGVVLGVVFVILVAVSVVWIVKDNNTDGDTESTDGTEIIMDDTELLNENTELDGTELSGTESDVLEPDSSETGSAVEAEDPQSTTGGGMTAQNGASVDISQVVKSTNETSEITLGIDVAKYQGTINWQKVANSGVDFAMVRVGYRTSTTGEIVADANARYNMQEAAKYGIKVGVYFFSTAVSSEEAIAEANWVADYIARYQITYPVVYNCEGYDASDSRQYGLTNTQRTDIAMAFLNRVSERGYTPMFYAAKSELESNAKWETSRISAKYKIWVAQYPSQPYPQTASSSYSGTHAMWQYTNNGTVPGISKPVDMNVAYFGYSSTSSAQSSEKAEEVTADPEANMKFTEVNESVTAKDKTNLRDIPSQGSDSKVLATLKNGEVATRTGISSSGWSRIVYNGKTYYAVSSYLTTDLSYKTPSSESSESESGIKTQFTAVDEWVTPKEEVNLRTLPSVTNEESQVVAKIKNGDVIHRIGINTELGWSKVEYNGQILYCVSSYLMLAE